MPLARGASMTTDKHVDPAAPPPAPPAAVDDAEGDVPESAVRFELEAAAIEEALVAPSLEVRAGAGWGSQAGRPACLVHG